MRRNPAYPGYTSSNGPNWVDYLTVKYNASLLQTYNLAVGGATVDSALVKPYLPTVLSVKQQVQDVFLPTYASSVSSASSFSPCSSSSSNNENGLQWSGTDSLFAFWIGINDVGNSYWQDDTAALNRQIFAAYADVVQTLYRDTGARNFVFLNREAADIAAFNALSAELAADLAVANATAEGGDAANVWAFDVHALFTQVLDRPAAYEATAGYANTTAFCEAYQNGTPNLDTLDPACGVPVNEYFWLNSLHPTYPIHDVVAEQVVAALEKGPNVCLKSGLLVREGLSSHYLAN
ncbi:family 16 carbohydrate esterase [Apiospora phragmitis]|uniref:Family 16 carbohydrate esterase n=1 Tax=Apiospora phragmitis TaxID=2905665 RepID=A0ABR1VF08_9PEZI